MLPVSATILDGKATAAAIKRRARGTVAELRAAGIVPGLGTVLVGDDPGSRAYVAGKHRDCAEVGIASIRVDLPATATQADVRRPCASSTPTPPAPATSCSCRCPRGSTPTPCSSAIDPAKDADGLHPVNLGRLVLGVAGAAALHAARHRGAAAPLRRAAGRRRGVRHRPRRHRRPPARPAADPQVSENATVTLCHTGTRDLAAHTRGADIVVAAAGVPRTWSPRTWSSPARRCSTSASPGRADGLVGDVQPDVPEVAGFVAPMPGGVGPMTRAMLLTNVVEAVARS